MFIGRKQKNKLGAPGHIFLKRFAKYCLILLLLFLVVIPIIYKSYTLAKNIILEESVSKISDGLATFSNQMQKCKEISDMLLDEKAFENLLLTKGDLPHQYYPNLNTVQSKLSSQIQGSDHLLDAFVLFKENSLLLSSYFTSDDAEKTYADSFYYKGTELDALREQIFSEHYQTKFLPVQPLYSSYCLPNSFESFTYFVTTSHYNQISNDSVMGFVFDMEKVYDSFLTKSLKEYGFFYLIDHQENILFSYQYDSPRGLAAYQWMEESTINGEPFYMMDAKNELMGLTMVAGISSSAFHKNVQELISVVVWYFLFGVLVITAISLWLTHRETREVKVILELSSRCLSGEPTELAVKNEYHFIGSVLNKIFSENQQYLLRINHLNDSVKICMLENLFMMGAYTQTEEESLTAIFDNDFEFYCVIKCSISPYSSQLMLDLESMLHTSLAQPMMVMNTHPGEMLLLLFLNDEHSCKVTELQKIFCGVGEAFQEEEIFHVGISQIHSGVKNVRNAYLQAQKAHSHSSEKLPVSLYDGVRNQNFKKMFDIAILIKLYEVIMVGEEAGALQLYDRILLFVKEQGLNEDESLQIFFLLRQVLSNLIIEVESSKKYANHSEKISLLSYTPSLLSQTLFAELRNTVIQLCGIISSAKRSSNDTLKEQIITYIENNYPNKALNAGLIADEFSIAEKYVFAVVKEFSGKSLGKFIEDLRLEKAEEYLAAKQYSNREIVDLVGFGSENTFYRIFSKKHGVSPSKWSKNDQ